MLDGLCVSTAQCSKRRMARVGVRLALENPPTPEPKDEQADVARATRRALYRYGLCTDCGLRPHSPGRPRCEYCHALPAVVRILMSGR